MNLELEQNEINFLVSILNNITIKALQPDAVIIATFAKGIMDKIEKQPEI